MVNEAIEYPGLSWVPTEKGVVTSDVLYRIERVEGKDFCLFIGQSETPIEDKMTLQEAYDRAEIVWAEDTI